MTIRAAFSLREQAWRFEGVAAYMRMTMTRVTAGDGRAGNPGSRWGIRFLCKLPPPSNACCCRDCGVDCGSADCAQTVRRLWSRRTAWSMTAPLFEALYVARDSAVLGEYAAASVYYEGVEAQITRCGSSAAQAGHTLSSSPGAQRANAECRSHVRGLSEPHQKTQWLRLRAAVAAELEAVTALELACAQPPAPANQPPPAAPQARATSFDCGRTARAA